MQTCAEAYDLLLSGDFGASGSDSAESYRQVCQKFFPYATKFNLISASLNSKDTSETPDDTIEGTTTTHNNSTSNNNVENNSEKITNSSPVKAEISEP